MCVCVYLLLHVSDSCMYVCECVSVCMFTSFLCVFDNCVCMCVYMQGSGPVLWTYTGRKTLPPSTSLPVMSKIVGVNTASLGGYLHSTKTRARWAEGFHELNGHVFDLERDGLRQVVLCPRLTMR